MSPVLPVSAPRVSAREQRYITGRSSPLWRYRPWSWSYRRACPCALAQARFVNGAYLLEQYHAVARKPHALGVKLNMRRQTRLACLARYCRSDHRWAVLIAGVVLDDEHRAHAALLRADDRA